MTSIAIVTSLLPWRAWCQTADHTFENASIAFVRNYMAEWSSPNPVALAYMDKVFANQAVYFDHTLNHAALIEAKRRFAERWPRRRFVVRPDDLSVTCDAQHLCTVWGLVDWQCQSAERDADATGTSVFDFQIQDGQTVVEEDGFVIARGRILPRDTAGVPDTSVIYSNADIPDLRQAFYDESHDRNWITAWLAAQRPFSGSAQSLGDAGIRQITEGNGVTRPYAVFRSDQGPIACMMTQSQPTPPPGTDVHLQGTVSIFIDKTMYLSNCSAS